MNEIFLLTYQELLEELKNSFPNNHLLLGNGFNNSLGIKTNYSEIFSRMEEEYSGYKEAKAYLENNNYDIEKLIGHLQEQINSSQNQEKKFLNDFIERNVKLDFMKATNSIVQESIKDIYRENNHGIYLMLKNFTKYFTLNYDPFLYLLLLKFKKEEDNSTGALAIQNTLLFQEKDLNQNQKNIYNEIEELRKSGVMNLYSKSEQSSSNLKETSKTAFQTIIQQHNQTEGKGWKTNDIKKACNLIWEKENNKQELDIQDGFRGELFNRELPQNLYFLHGAFKIIKNKETIQKITAKQNKSFVQKLEETIHNEDQDIVCVLTSQSKEKKTQISNNAYLTKCFDSLSKIKGTLVILGSCLAKNDRHIFNEINRSAVTHIYISSCAEKKEQDYSRSREIFNNKHIILFDYKSISYRDVNQS